MYTILCFTFNEERKIKRSEKIHIKVINSFLHAPLQIRLLFCVVSLTSIDRVVSVSRYLQSY